jgi:hypothetical protein
VVLTPSADQSVHYWFYWCYTYSDVLNYWTWTIQLFQFIDLCTVFIIPGDQKGLFELAIQLRPFCYSAVCNTATGYAFDRYLTWNQKRQNCRLCMYKNQRYKETTSTVNVVWSHQQPEVTPVIPFESKNQYCQLKQSFLITLYHCTIFKIARLWTVKGMSTLSYLQSCHMEFRTWLPYLSAIILTHPMLRPVMKRSFAETPKQSCYGKTNHHFLRFHFQNTFLP